jgi:hypothetical protein
MWEPFGNTTVLPPAQWHPEPQFRGTFSILFSCLITMSLCIWTSLHLNVPEHKKEHLQKYRKLGWMVLGLLAPELVLWNAWEQRKRVKELNARMRIHGFMSQKPDARERVCRWFQRAGQKIRVPFTPGDTDPRELADLMSSRTHNDRLNDWTDVHSWLVVMGGMVFEDKSSEEQQFMPGNQTRYPITSEMIAWMAGSCPHLVPDISREYIEDKSKSDWLAKGLTCWQAGYFCIQCTFRLSQRLSITLLELNVFAHAICALLLFLIWWDKPRDVLVPIANSSEEALDICVEHLYSNRKVVDNRGKKYRMKLMPILQHPSPDECFEIVQPTTIIIRRHSESKFFMSLSARTHHKFLKVKDTYWQLEAVFDSTSTSIELDAARCFDNDIAIEFTGRDISGLERMYRYYTQSRPTNGRYQSPPASIAIPKKSRISNWSLGVDQVNLLFEIDELSDHSRTIAGATFASACYGGLHLIAWTSAFPSHAALVLWRVASVTLLATGPFCAAIAAVDAGLWWLSERSLSGVACLDDALLEMLEYFLALAFIWYTLCRTFIVVECFILLAHIPESALRVPTWAAYIPSFG